ncbi:hypothetical protein AB1N83_005902 [Pleurotus pulmonarius]
MSDIPSPFVPGMNLDVAELAGIIFEGIAYGAFMTLAIATIYLLLHKSGHRSWIVLSTVILMMLLATAQITVDSINIFIAFVDKSRLDRLLWMSNPTTDIYSTKHSIVFTMITVGDLINAFRCYVVWGNNIYVALPAILMSLASASCAYQTIWATQHIATVTHEGEFAWGIALMTLSIAANVYSTCMTLSLRRFTQADSATAMMGYRIWYNERHYIHDDENRKRNSLMPILYIIIETGALNAAYLIAYIAVLQSGSQGVGFLAEFTTPWIGCIFTLMIVRVQLRAKQSTELTAMSQNQTVPYFASSGKGSTQVEERSYDIGSHYSESSEQAAKRNQSTDNHAL